MWVCIAYDESNSIIIMYRVCKAKTPNANVTVIVFVNHFQLYSLAQPDTVHKHTQNAVSKFNLKSRKSNRLFKTEMKPQVKQVSVSYFDYFRIYQFCFMFVHFELSDRIIPFVLQCYVFFCRLYKKKKQYKSRNSSRWRKKKIIQPQNTHISEQKKIQQSERVIENKR